MMTRAWVFSVILDSMSARSGFQPFVLVAQVVHRRAAGEGDRAGPQRVVGRRDQDLVAVVDEGLQHHRDQLGDAVADEDVLDRDVAQPALLVVLRDRRPGGVDALGVAVALRLGQVVDHVGDDRLGRLEAERRRVADVQLEDPVALGLEPVRLDQDRPAHVVADVAGASGSAGWSHGHILAGECPRRRVSAYHRSRRAMSRTAVRLTPDHLDALAVALPLLPVLGAGPGTPRPGRRPGRREGGVGLRGAARVGLVRPGGPGRRRAGRLRALCAGRVRPGRRRLRRRPRCRRTRC